MRNFLIKIGKVKMVLERDGFWVGLTNVMSKLFKLIRGLCRYSSGDIVFISVGLGDASLYRTDHIAEELRIYGFKTIVLYKDDPFLLKKIKRFRVIVLYRATLDLKIKKLLEQAERIKQGVIYDTDDLVFDLELFKTTDAYKNFNSLQKKEYKKSVGLEILESEQLKAITTSTSFLANKLERFKKPVFVVKNKLSQQELKWSWEARKMYLNRNKIDKEVRLGYFSGTVSHNRDFATIIPALEVVLQKYKNVKLYLVGYLDINDHFYQKFQKQIVQLPFVSRKYHYQNIAKIDINLAPLEMNDFCQAKSELKFFEAGIIGVPTVAVNNQTFSEAIEDGKTGLLAKSDDEWIDKMSKLIENKEYRMMIGENARQLVLKKYLTTSGDNKKYYEFLESLIN